MILKGSQRGRASALAKHLTNTDDNEHVELFSVRGFASDTLHGALLESYAVSKGTKCTQHMFSLSLNPPKTEDVPISSFEDALTRVEERLGLEDQPRIVVFHEKEGRRHAHAVWSRIDAADMKAVNLPYFKTKLRDVSRELYFEHNWKMPKGLMNSEERDPANFTLAEWQQAKRVKQSRAELSSQFQDCWQVSDSKTSFEHALRERGFLLARGSKRSFVAVDYRGEVYSLSRMTKRNKKELKERLGNPENLKTIEQCETEFAQQMTKKLSDFVEQSEGHMAAQAEKLEKVRKDTVLKHRQEREKLERIHKRQLEEERCQRQEKLAKGIRGFWQRLTGKYGKILRENQAEEEKSIQRNRVERQALIQSQLQERSRFQIFVNQSRKCASEEISELRSDILNYPELRNKSLSQKRYHTVTPIVAIETSNKIQPRH